METHATTVNTGKTKRKAITSKGANKVRRNERNILTFYEKIAVIRYYDETNISRNSLAKMFHCCATQIRRILEKKRELMQQLATLSEADASIIIEEMTRKRRKFEMSAISFLLHQWVERSRKMRLSGSINNQTLKSTAMKMATVLNLPAFRPSYRWLNRFRDKYKYEEDDLGYMGQCSINGDLPIEQIILEFKSSLPNFMQKELGETKDDDGDGDGETKLPSNENSVFSEGDAILLDDEDGEDDVIEVLTCEPNILPSRGSTPPTEDTISQPDGVMNAGTCTLLNSVYPHLAIIHQFAVMNSDVQALELISQLGVHMQQQATSGAYTTLTLATNSDNSIDQGLPEGSIFADIDDIELIE